MCGRYYSTFYALQKRYTAPVITITFPRPPSPPPSKFSFAVPRENLRPPPVTPLLRLRRKKVSDKDRVVDGSFPTVAPKNARAGAHMSRSGTAAIITSGNDFGHARVI